MTVEVRDQYAAALGAENREDALLLAVVFEDLEVLTNARIGGEVVRAYCYTDRLVLERRG